MSIGQFDNANLTGGQRLATKYFMVAMVLFLVFFKRGQSRSR